MRTGREYSLVFDGRRFAFVLVVGLIALTLFGAAPRPHPGMFVGVGFWNGEIRLLQASGKPWNLRVYEGCNLMVYAREDPTLMPQLSVSADSTGRLTDDQCVGLYREPQQHGVSGP